MTSPMDPMRYKVAIVKWVDARKTGEIQYPSEFENYQPVMIYSAGFVYERSDAVCVAMECYPEALTQAEGLRTVEVIPKECVKEVVYLERAGTPPSLYFEKTEHTA